MSEKDQRAFFGKVKDLSELTNKELGRLVDLKARAYRDWTAGRRSPRLDAIKKLAELFKVSVPKDIEVREENWGQVKGGKVSQLKRLRNPQAYEGTGVILRNKFKKPEKNCRLAEFVGVVLGDGSVTEDQCQICLHLKDDKRYADYLSDLIVELFGYHSGSYLIKSSNARRVIVSGRNFVFMLNEFGIPTGDKMKNKIDIPGWIKSEKQYYQACIKGLFDTDGGSYFHRHWVGDYKYRHFGLTFTSGSKDLQKSFSRGLDQFSIKNSISGINVMIYSLKEVGRFFKIFKPANKKHWVRYEWHLSRSTRLN